MSPSELDLIWSALQKGVWSTVGKDLTSKFLNKLAKLFNKKLGDKETKHAQGTLEAFRINQEVKLNELKVLLDKLGIGNNEVSFHSELSETREEYTQINVNENKKGGIIAGTIHGGINYGNK